VVKIDNENYDAYMQLGLLLGAQLDPLGIDYLDNAIRIKELSTEALYARGKLYQDLAFSKKRNGLYKEAAKDYNKILDINENYAAAFYNLGWINFQLENFENARAYFNKTVQTDEGYVDAYYMRGLSEYAIGNYTEARKNFKLVLQLVPQYSKAQDMLDLIESR